MDSIAFDKPVQSILDALPLNIALRKDLGVKPIENARIFLSIGNVFHCIELGFIDEECKESFSAIIAPTKGFSALFFSFSRLLWAFACPHSDVCVAVEENVVNKRAFPENVANLENSVSGQSEYSE